MSEHLKNNPKSNPSERKGTNPYMKYSGMAFQLIGGIILGYFVGSKVDQWLEIKTPAFTIGLALFFAIGSLVLIIRDLMKE